MRALPLLLAFALATTAVALVPAAEAANRCTFLDSWCWGLACWHNGHQWTCVHEPDPDRLVCNDTYCLQTLVLP